MSDDPASHDSFKWECRRNHIESLRIPWEGMGAMANAERNIAALMIENLMEEVEAWKKAMQKAERDMEELRAERDEARREICAWAARHFKEYEEHVARERGWNCFEENTND